MILIIAEKPSVAKTIAAVVGATTKKNGYFEGNGYFVTNAFGHMYTLFDVVDYNSDISSSWNLNDYPFIPTTFNYKPSDEAYLKKQLSIIRNLLKDSKSVINALDADREGSLIFYELKKMLNISLPIKRLWANTQTEDGIRKELANLYDDDGKIESSGIVRQHIDWIIGINLTTLYTLKLKSRTPIKIGRVVLPTLFLIYSRNKEINSFVPSSSYSLFSNFKSDSFEHVFQYYKDDQLQFDTKDELQAIGSSIVSKNGCISSISRKYVKQSAEKLFSLTDLQSHITASHQNFTASKVLDIAQSLYEKGVTSYPRTESRYLHTAMINDVNSILLKIKNSCYSEGADPSLINFHTNLSVFNDKLVDSHFAIIPTGVFKSLTSDEQVVYDAIILRFLSLFMPSATFEEYEIVATVDNHNFRLKGRNLVDSGYLSIHSVNTKDNIDLSVFKENQSVFVDSFDVREIVKKAPKQYTESTLLKAMESCGKNVEDVESILKGYTIGTSATRAETIEKLKSSGYISIKGRSLLMTELGNTVVENFPAKVFFDSDFTGKIEKALKDIEKGLADPDKIKLDIITFSNAQFKLILDSNIQGISNEPESLGICPLCGGNIVENRKAYSCSNSMSGSCILTLWKEDKYLDSWGIKLTTAHVKSLIKNGYFNVKSNKTNIKLKVSVIHNEELNKLNYNIVK